MAFWLAAGAMALAVGALMALALWRGRVAAGPGAAYDLQVYRDQLREVERDAARGIIPASEAERLRVEVSRRVLDADRALQGAGPSLAVAPRVATLGALMAVVAVLMGGVWAYLRLGAPGYPDLPIAERIAMSEEWHRTRPDQAEAVASLQGQAFPLPEPDPQFLELMEKLRTAVAARPDDLTGHELLARNEAALGNYDAAIAAQGRVIALRPGGATAEDHAALAEMMILAAAGYVSPEAEAELTEALRRDPQNGSATYYAGLMFRQIGRPDRAFALWEPLLARSAPDAPWLTAVRTQLPQVAMEAGVRYQLPAAEGPAGPSAADVEAAGEMTPEERQEMIRGMVAGLAERLATEGGPAEDWARLITAYGVLGETDQAAAIWAEAQGRFADRAADLDLVREAARGAGVAP
jgi:cytochrome c-type biogenesis protein CcmH